MICVPIGAANLISIFVLDADGTSHTIDAAPGLTVMEALRAAGMSLKAACGGSLACATCHVLIRQGGDSLPAPDDEEEDQLDMAWGLEAASRLACCVRLGQADITVELPRHSRNHAREK